MPGYRVELFLERHGVSDTPLTFISAARSEKRARANALRHAMRRLDALRLPDNYGARIVHVLERP